jgi:hypothetical protein
LVENRRETIETRPATTNSAKRSASSRPRFSSSGANFTSGVDRETRAKTKRMKTSFELNSSGFDERLIAYGASPKTRANASAVNVADDAEAGAAV